MKVFLTAILTLAISGARIGMGLFNGITGPTMFYLANNIDATIGTVSYMFLGRSIGVLAGAILGGFIKRFNPKFGQLAMLGAAVAFLGVAMMIIPWISALWMLLIDMTLGGVMYGYLDAGLQALLLQIWGEVKSRVHIQLFHFTYVVGATFAPLLVQPFLLMVDRTDSKQSRCTVSKADTTDSFNNYTIATTALPMLNATQDEMGFNPVGWAYVISALWMLSVGFFTLVLAKYNFEGKIAAQSTREAERAEVDKEEPLRDVIWVFLPTIAFFFTAVATENVFYNFIYSVAMCSGLQFSVSQATLANSLVWIGLGVGRLSGVIVSNYLSPRMIIIIGIIGSIIDSFVMMLFGEHYAWIAWTVAFLHGVTPSCMYPSGVSWLSQITNVSITYMSVFTIGAFLAVFTMLPLAGYIFDHYSPFGLMTQVFALAAINAIFYALALYAGKKHQEFLKRKRADENEELKNLSVNGYEKDEYE